MSDLAAAIKQGLPDIELDLQKELQRREVKRRADAAEHPPQPIPPSLSLDERLKLKARPKVWLIDSWLQDGHRVVLAAQFKAGKTKLVANVVRSLVDGVPFLDKFAVAPVNLVTVLDFEMLDRTDERVQLDDWYEAIGIKRRGHLHLKGLKGCASSFNILDSDVRARWLNDLTGTDFLVVDCLRPVFDALGLDESRDAGTFFVAFDALLKEANIRGALVVHHMGHQNERSRGDSRILDWPDVNWTLVRETEDPASRRFIKAFGRDVDVPETALVFNPKLNRLAIGQGSRQDVKVNDALAAILVLLDQSGSLSARKIENELDGPTQGSIRKAIKRGVEQKTLLKGKGGQGGGSVYSKVTP